jgi:hypothetical protein
MRKMTYSTLIVCLILLVSWKQDDNKWIVEDHLGFGLSYTLTDKPEIGEYLQMTKAGIEQVQVFFDDTYKKKFGIFIHPHRESIDKQWATDWKIPGYKSECWMVASGIPEKLDLLSPAAWEKESCEHDFHNKTEIQQIITHELIHVFHGQVSNTVDFGDFNGLDWFVEGLATYASGQCDSKRIDEIKEAILKKEIPDSLDDFWKGKLRYGLSGSVVMYLDSFYGRNRLKELLKFKTKEEMLGALQISEGDLLSGWKKYMGNFKN